MNKLNKEGIHALALDFDGVVWDTQREGYFLSQLVWKRLFGRWAFCTEKAFLSGRWLARAGEEFGLLLSIAENISLKAPECSEKIDFTAFPPEAFAVLASKSGIFLRLFGKNLASMRSEVRQADLKQWLSWQNVFPEADKVILKLQNAGVPIGLCTTKDGASAESLLETAGIRMLMRAKECSLDKRVSLLKLAEDLKTDIKDVLFVDDLLENLLLVKPLGVQTALAGWGYNGASSVCQAEKLGIPVLSSPEDLLELI